MTGFCRTVWTEEYVITCNRRIKDENIGIYNSKHIVIDLIVRHFNIRLPK